MAKYNPNGGEGIYNRHHQEDQEGINQMLLKFTGIDGMSDKKGSSGQDNQSGIQVISMNPTPAELAKKGQGAKVKLTIEAVMGKNDLDQFKSKLSTTESGKAGLQIENYKGNLEKGSTNIPDYALTLKHVKVDTITPGSASFGSAQSSKYGRIFVKAEVM